MEQEIITKFNSILIGENLCSSIEGFLNENYKDSKKIILTDENVFDLWIENLITSIPALSEAEIIQIPAGESSKSIEIAVQLWEALSEYDISRNDVLVNFGGGMISDMGGFVASTYMRGIDFINIPTTLLSQVDASVGGKTGIDLNNIKNLIGSFAHAKKVFVSTSYLETLESKEVLSGYAEMLKHGLIDSKKHWTSLTKLTTNEIIKNPGLIKSSIEIKQKIVDADFRENNIRKNLNFGHTIGHGIESLKLSQNNPIPHGIAIAWGMIAESFISLKKGLISKDIFSEIKYIIYENYPLIDLNESDLPHILAFIKKDKKNDQTQINFSLINDIGSSIHNQPIDKTLIIESIKQIIA